MRILHIASGYPIQYQGGIQNYVRLLATSQADNNNHVMILAGKGSVVTNPNVNVYVLDSGKVLSNLYGELYDNRQYAEFKKIIDLNEFDIIHVHSVLGLDWNILKLLSDRLYVVSLHDYNFICPRIQMIDKNGCVCKKYDAQKCQLCVSYQERFRLFRGTERLLNQLSPVHVSLHIPQNATKIRYMINRDFLEYADMLLPVSRRVMEIYVDSGIRNDYKVLHIGNIMADNYNSVNKYEKHEGPIVAAMIGTMNKAKGAEIFLKIAKLCKNDNIIFVFIGKSGSYSRELADCGIVDKGPYMQSNLTKLLEEVDIGFALSIWEDNAPQVVMEFLNNHIPVVGTTMGGIPDFINQSNGYLYNPYSDTEFDNLMNWLNNLNLDMIHSMRKNIVPTPTPAEHSAEIMKIYERVLTKGGKQK